MDSGGPLERVEAGHSEAWASELADLVRHWFGETEDAPRELPLTAQEPGEDAGQPGVEAGHSEVRAGEAADLERHRLGGTEDASKELPHTVRGRERRSADLDCRKSPARFRGSRRPREAVTAAGRDITRTCARVRTVSRRRWRLRGLDHVRRPVGLRGSGCPREASAKAGQVAAGERSTR